MSAENTCTFNKNKLFKKFKENLQWLQELLHVYLHTCRIMRKWKLLPSIPGCGLYFPPRRAPEIPMGKGSKRRQFPKWWGQILKVFFSRDFETRIIVFIDDILPLKVIAECFFHSLPVWHSLHVSNVIECHRLMNNAGHPVHCFIFHNIIVVFTVVSSCSISLLLTCF